MARVRDGDGTGGLSGSCCCRVCDLPDSASSELTNREVSLLLRLKRLLFPYTDGSGCLLGSLLHHQERLFSQEGMFFLLGFFGVYC